MNHILYQDGILKALPFKRLPWTLGKLIEGNIAFREMRAEDGRDTMENAVAGPEPDPKINPAVNGPDAGCSWSCRELGSENDLVAEGIEAADQTLGHAMLVLLVEMSGTEFTELSVTSKDVEHREQDLVSDGHRGAFGAQARLEPVVLLLVVGALGLGGARRRAKQRRLEMRVALARARLARPAGALVIAGAHAGPGGKPTGVAEHRQVDPGLGENLRSPDLVNAGNALQKPDLPTVRPHPLGHPRLQIALDLVEPAQVQAQQKAMMLAHTPLERLDQ